MKNVKFLIILVFIVIISLNLWNAGNRTEYTNVTVNKLVAQNLISGSADDLSTEIRYLVVTNRGTFICESSLLSDKFNNSEIFYNLKEGATYKKFVTIGLGKSFFSDYKNLIFVE